MESPRGSRAGAHNVARITRAARSTTSSAKRAEVTIPLSALHKNAWPEASPGRKLEPATSPRLVIVSPGSSDRYATKLDVPPSVPRSTKPLAAVHKKACMAASPAIELVPATCLTVIDTDRNTRAAAERAELERGHRLRGGALRQCEDHCERSNLRGLSARFMGSLLGLWLSSVSSN